MKLAVYDYLIVIQSMTAIVMLFLAILLWIRKRDLSSILFFLIVLFLYIQSTIKSLAYYHILNVETLIKVGNISLINYLVEIVLFLLVICFILVSIKIYKSDNNNNNDKFR